MKSAVISLLASATLAVACTAENPTTATTGVIDLVATINGRVISQPMLAHYARMRAQKEPEDLTPEEREALIDELVQMALLANAADSDGLLEDQAFAAELELQRLQSIARRQVAAYLASNSATEAELQQAYEENLEQFAGVQYKARHILVDEESTAQAIIATLQQGADFQELARTQSTGPSGPNGGDLGWFTADRMVPPFAAAVRAMEVGTFSTEPVQTRFGWHVILLEERSDGQAPGLDAVRNDVITIVEQQKVQEYLDRIRASAEVL